MQRVEENKEVKSAVVVTAEEFERDWERGYAIGIFSPARIEILRDARSGTEIEHPVPAVLLYCCMRCKFSTVIEDVMKEHNIVQADQIDPHPWLFDVFTNPYGHFMDVVIEGIDRHSYDSAVKEKTRHG